MGISKANDLEIAATFRLKSEGTLGKLILNIKIKDQLMLKVVQMQKCKIKG